MIVIIGGSGSGKSAFAEQTIVAVKERKRGSTVAKEDKEEQISLVYLATMEVFGEEGKERVEKHRKMRQGKGFQTIEAQRDVGNISFETKEKPYVLLECLSNLVANEMFAETSQEQNPSVRGLNVWIQNPEELVNKIKKDLKALEEKCEELVIVTNQVFSDAETYDIETEMYRKVLGEINESLVAAADEAWEVVAGIPLRLK